MKGGDIVKLSVTATDIMGNGVARADGMVIFVPYAILGEQVTVKITAIKKRYGYGELISIDEPSDMRINPDCDCFMDCGGCNFQHLTYDHEVAVKKEFVASNLRKFAGIDNVVIDDFLSHDITHYRNSAQYHVVCNDGKVSLGFYAKGSRKFVEVRSCLIMAEPINLIKSSLEIILSEHWELAEKISHVVVKLSSIGEVMVIFVTRDHGSLEKPLGKLLQLYPQIKSVYQCVNKNNRGYVLAGKMYHLWGCHKIMDCWNGVSIAISPTSFIQVNHEARESLYSRVGALVAAIDPTVVYDLYCGLGGIGMSLGLLSNIPIIGVDQVESAIADATFMAKRNGINGEYYVGKVEDLMGNLVKNHDPGSLIILDPPRSGLDPKIMPVLKNFAGSVIYISCNASTFARDMKELSAWYCLSSLSLHDLFPRTGGVELVAVLTK